MPVYYDFQCKSYYRPQGERFQTMRDALAYLKKILREDHNFQPELVAISQSDLPAPKYRASVGRYLYQFFCTGSFPSPDMIDYSDFEGKRRGFPVMMNADDAEDASEYEKILGFSELYLYRGVREYDRRLGFIFGVSKRGFHIEFLGDKLKTVCYFYRQPELAAFGFETMNNDRHGLDARIFRSEGELPPKISGSFNQAILLSILLSQKDKRPIQLSENQATSSYEEENDRCLLWKLNSVIYDKMNSGFILPAEISLSDRTVERYIESLRRFGYTVEEIDREYYIPPFINIKDADMIIKCINSSELDAQKKRELVEKFELDSGYHRYFQSLYEESAYPLPPCEKWKKGDYSLVILNMLRLCDRPLLMTSGKKENLKELIESHYGIEIGRKAISDNIKAMMAMGLPVKEEKDGVVFDTSNRLRKSDIDTIKACISQSPLSPETASHLISKLDEKLPIGKY